MAKRPEIERGRKGLGVPGPEHGGEFSHQERVSMSRGDPLSQKRARGGAMKSSGIHMTGIPNFNHARAARADAGASAHQPKGGVTIPRPGRQDEGHCDNKDCG